MSKQEPTLIDGFASVQAIKRSGRAPQDQPRLRHSATRLPQAETPAPEMPARPGPATPPASRIGHTALPARHDLVCYECLYAFTVNGKMHVTICPKCKRNLDIRDHVLTGECAENLSTMGSVTIAPDALLGAITIVAQNVTVNGDATRATLRCTRRLALGAGGDVTLARTSFREFAVEPDAAFSHAEPLVARVIDIGGKLRANIRAEERVHLRATGDYRGELYSPRLVMEDGARLNAAVFLGPGVAAVPNQDQHAA